MEGGAAQSFTLASPGTGVTVDFTQKPGAEASIEISTDGGLTYARTGSYTFVAADLTTPKQFFVRSVADSDSLTGTANFLITARTAAFPVIGFTPQLVTVNQIDASLSPLVLSTDPAAGLTVSEGGVSTITAKLSVQPLTATTITITKTSGDSDVSLLSSATLTFTPANWNTPQKVTFAAAEDTDTANGSAVFTFSTPGFADKTLTVSEVDNLRLRTTGLSEVNNDVAKIVLSTDYLPVLEGGSRTFTVQLPFAPTSDVIVSILKQAGSSDDLYNNLGTLTFTASNWNQPQTVTIRAISDANWDHETATFIISAPGYVTTKLKTDEIQMLQSVRPLGNAFRVNTFTVDAQTNPSVSMDSDGNFVDHLEQRRPGHQLLQRHRRPAIQPRRRPRGQRVHGQRRGHQHPRRFLRRMSPDGQFFLVTWMMGGVIEPGS